jgi:endonuclease/exonuclease/phosphatase (EEP) superfamily protein YafD
MKKSFFVFVVAASLLFQSCASVINFMDPEGPEYHGSYAVASAASILDIKIVTYNIAWGKRAEQAAKELQYTPELKNADIILLQEMDAAGVENMAQALGYNYVYFPGSIHNLTNKDIGNAILSRWALSEEKKLIFPHKQSWNDRIRLAAVATAIINGKRVRVYNVHAATVMMSENKQFDQLESVLADVSGDYDAVIVGGDFNTARPGSVKRSQHLFGSAGFLRASDGAGYTSKALGLIPFTLDHIFTKGLNVLQAGVVKHAEASDHLPLWAVLEFDEKNEILANRPAKVGVDERRGQVLRGSVLLVE